METCNSVVECLAQPDQLTWLGIVFGTVILFVLVGILMYAYSPDDHD